MIPVSDLMTACKSTPYYYKTIRYESYAMSPSSAAPENVPSELAIVISGEREGIYEQAVLDNTSTLIKFLEMYEHFNSPCQNGLNRIPNRFLEVFNQYGYAFSSDVQGWNGNSYYCVGTYQDLHDTRGKLCPIWGLYDSLSRLYFLYSNWASIYVGRNITSQCKNPYEWLLRSFDAYENINILENYIKCFGDITIHRKLDFVDGVPIVRNECTDLFTVLEAQMQDIIMQGDAGTKNATAGATIGYCKECHTPFIRRHGNASLCEYHRRNDVKVSNSRARKKAQRKEQDKDAQQTRES